MIHELKILPEHYQPVLEGLKRAELRNNDRDYKVGDHLILKEWHNGDYTGRQTGREVIHVADVSAYLHGFVLLSVK